MPDAGIRDQNVDAARSAMRDSMVARQVVLVGVLENLVGHYIAPAYKEGVALMLFLVVILVRPEGLLGKTEERKV